MAQRVHRLPGHVAVRILSRTGTESTTAAAQELFVYLDATRDVAYVVHDGGTGLHWEEISRRDAELLMSIGARALVEIAAPVRSHP